MSRIKLFLLSISVMGLGININAAKILSDYDTTSATNWKISIPKQYLNTSMTAMGSGIGGDGAGGAGATSLALKNASSTTLYSIGNSHREWNVSEISLIYTGVVQSSFYTLNLTTGATNRSLKSFQIILWDAPGEDVNNLEKSIKAELEILRELIKIGDENLKAQLDKAIADLEAKIKAGDDAVKKELLATIENLKDALEAEDSKIRQEMADQLAALEAKLAEADSVNKADLEAQIANLKAVLEATDAANKAELKKDLADLEAKLALVDAENRAALEKQITDLKTTLEAADAANKAELKKDLADLETKLALADAENKAALEKQIAELKKMMNDENALIRQQLANEIARIELSLDLLNKAIQKRLTSLENRLYYSLLKDETLVELEIKKREYVNLLANEIAVLEIKLQEAEIGGDQSEITQIKDSLEVKTLAYDKARCDYDDLVYAIDIRESTEFNAHELEIENLKRLLASQKADLEALSQRLKDEMAKLEEMLKAYADAGNKEMLEAIEKLKSELATLQANMQILASRQSNSGGTSSGSMNNGFGINAAAPSNAIPTDSRDLRTSDSTMLQW